MNRRWLKAVSCAGGLALRPACAEVVTNGSRLFASGSTRYPFSFETYSGTHLKLEDFYELVIAWMALCRDEYRVPPDARAILDLGRTTVRSHCRL